MKQKKSLKTLTLKKHTVADLSRVAMHRLRAGEDTVCSICIPTGSHPHKTQAGADCTSATCLSNNIDTEGSGGTGDGGTDTVTCNFTLTCGTTTEYNPVL